MSLKLRALRPIRVVLVAVIALAPPVVADILDLDPDHRRSGELADTEDARVPQ